MSGLSYKTGLILDLTFAQRLRQTLAFTNLIPNYTVKALTASWCESNNVKQPDHGRTGAVSCTHSDSNMSHEVTVDGDDVALHAAEAEHSANPTGPQGGPNFPSRLETRYCGQVSSPTQESRAELLEIENQVKKHVEELKSGTLDAQTKATGEIRLLAKNNMENRIVIANCGAISLLVGLLLSTDSTVQENAVTALLNVSINDNNKSAIANADAIEPLIHVLQTGSPESKENAAGTLLSLLVIDENKIKIGESGVIQPLVDLLGNGNPIGNGTPINQENKIKKDAATALFNLSINQENKGRIVQAGAVKYLVELVDPAFGMVDKAVLFYPILRPFVREGRQLVREEEYLYWLRLLSLGLGEVRRMQLLLCYSCVLAAVGIAIWSFKKVPFPHWWLCYSPGRQELERRRNNFLATSKTNAMIMLVWAEFPANFLVLHTAYIEILKKEKLYSVRKSCVANNRFANPHFGFFFSSFFSSFSFPSLSILQIVLFL